MSDVPGTVVPSVDHGRCEAKRECVAVCPVDVFEVRRIDQSDFDRLGALGRLRSRAHRRMTAYPVRADDCEACGHCVAVCPEHAITLVPRVAS
ncbi:MAG TPA: 4Fe-4S dicluster domain-containing protein [Acidimicrobiia bacterium]